MKIIIIIFCLLCTGFNLGLAENSKFFISKIKLQGNTIFLDNDLAPMLKPFENRLNTAEDIYELITMINKFYFGQGYINSGVILPDQDLKDGIIYFKLIEGRLSSIEIKGNTWLRSGYIQARLKGHDQVLNIHKLQQDLKLLEADVHINTLNTELSPGRKLGQGILKIKVQENQPWHLSFEFNNHNSPGIGPWREEFRLSHNNLSGWGDSLSLSYALTKGLDDFGINYVIPVTAQDTTLGCSYGRSKAKVVTTAFKKMGIRSQNSNYAVFVRHPFYKTLTREFALGLKLDRNESETFLLGQPFGATGDDEGQNRTSILRFSQELVLRSMRQVIAMHSSFNFGLDLLNASVQDQDPDGKFFTWLGQFQWIYRITWLESQLFLRANLQISNDGLLPVEKFAIGGSNTVRGFRENQITTDNGMTTSLEWQVPLFTLKVPYLSKSELDGEIQAVPFFDYGYGWNAQGDNPDPDELYSVGLGLRWHISAESVFETYWGHALTNIEEYDAYDIQDDGFHFRFKVGL